MSDNDIRVVTCRTPGCHNQDIAIIWRNPGQAVFCAGCNQFITDIDPPLPEVEVVTVEEIMEEINESV